MPESYEISSEYLSSLVALPTKTEADETSRLRAIVQAFNDIKSQSVKHSENREWDSDATFDSLSEETIKGLGEIVTTESIEKVFLTNTLLSDFGLYIAQYIIDSHGEENGSN